MNFRLAVMQDLPQLKVMYRKIVKNMNEHGIQIWDDIYPCEFLAEDIKKQQLYILIENENIVSAFSLCDTNAGEMAVQWQENSAKASKAEYLRLFVVNVNEPAIKLYIKNGFIKADGIFNEVFNDGFTLHEYGYEAKL